MNSPALQKYAESVRTRRNEKSNLISQTEKLIRNWYGNAPRYQIHSLLKFRRKLKHGILHGIC